jgi:hypothetical protein
MGEYYQDTAGGLQARLENIRLTPKTDTAPTDEEFPETTLISKTYALPFASAELQVQSLEWNVFDLQGNLLGTEQNRGIDALRIGNTFTFREMRGFTVLIETQVSDGENIRTLKSVEFSLAGSSPILPPQSVSPAFVDAYKELADNYSTSYLRDLPRSRPKMLIISHTNLTNYQNDFINWKKAQGFDIFVAYKSQIGETLNDFRQFIQDHYQQNHCDYLLLLGDVTNQGSYTIPTAFYPSPEYAENDADDHQYTLLEGDDYFPEMLVGRMSFNDISEFLTMANKTVTYERSPFMGNTTWMTRGLAVAGNYAEGGLRPITPVQMSRWLRNRMLDYGYAAVDTVFYPPTYPGTSSITAAINQGVQFVSYRGWGDANGWHYPSFHIPDLNSTNSGPRMPVVFSIVCNTGDFANPVNPSFGEKWMRMGSVAQPNGCVAFVGPSDLHTKTRLNNSISSGAFRSIIDYGVRGFASSVLMGKIELYKTFPNDLADNQYVAFYFHVYNIQADPSLKMWVLVPDAIPESVIEGGLTFSQSDSHIRIEAPANEWGTVTGTKNGTDYSYAEIRNGVAILPIDPDTTGDLTITVTDENFVPLVRTLAASEPAGIGIVDNNLEQDILAPNETVSGEIVLKNYSANSITVNNLGITADLADVAYNHSSFTLAANATHTISFQVTGHAEIMPRRPITFTLQGTDPVMNQEFQMWGGGAEFTFLNCTGNIGIGQTSTVEFEVMNTGSSPISNATGQCVSLTEAATFGNGGNINLGSFAVGETKTFNMDITVGGDAWNGRNLPMKMTVSSNGYNTTVFYDLTAGTPQTTSPTGPDAYGYYAYDNFDTGFAATPQYAWVETDPELGGQGTVWEVMDDGSHTIDLPFSFRFYGRNYNQLTMCSNGWISLMPTDMEDFYNCYIPAALGPYAMIAGYWDDLKGMKTGVDPDTGDGIFANMRLIYWHDTANNRFFVQWNDAYNQYNIDLMEDASLEKFQIILYPQPARDGDIVIQYHTVDNPGVTTNYCTVGIENHTQTVGLGYTHSNFYPPTATPLQAGLAVKFTTVAPDDYVANEDLVNTAPFQLAQNYPNPFNPSTTISFSTRKSGTARLAIYNTKGQLVRTLLDTKVDSGNHNIVWNGTDDSGNPVSSGLYLYRLDHDGQSQTLKMLLMK